jgi:hypothetical protein
MVKKFIDFKLMTKPELLELSSKWERDAMKMEFTLENERNKATYDKLFEIANKLWRRLKIIEDYIKKN